MAQFIGTVQEFHHLIGPKIRNAVNQAAGNHRKRLGGVCQACGMQAELHSAHVHGRDRRTLIEAVLKDYTDDTGVVSCDLAAAESRIIESHLPIEDTFKFLCHLCHVAYDAGTRTSDVKRMRSIATKTLHNSDGFRKLGKIQLWASRPHQTNHRMIRAFLLLELDGEVTLPALKEYCTRELNVANFDGNYASMKTDAGHSHGRVFFDDGATVKMWPSAREEVDLHFSGHATCRTSAST